MSKTIINLTTQVVAQEMQMVLETYPHHPYQEAFANPDFRQSLMAYILSRIPNDYITVTEEQPVLISPSYLHEYLVRVSQMEAIIHQGIEEILCEQAQEVKRHIPELPNPGFMPSDWFG